MNIKINDLVKLILGEVNPCHVDYDISIRNQKKYEKLILFLIDELMDIKDDIDCIDCRNNILENIKEYVDEN